MFATMRVRFFPRAGARTASSLVTCTALVMAPHSARAFTAAPAEPTPAQPAPAEPAPAQPAPAEPTPTKSLPVASEIPGEDTPANTTVTTAPAPYDEAPTSAPGPSTVETTEDSAATDQLEGTALETQEPLPAGVPERLPPLQLAGWWSTFAGISLATAGGIFAGLAEREQNEAEQLATSFNVDAGSRLLYEDVRSDYERHLKRGGAFAWTSRGFLIAGGLAVVSGIVLFALHKKRSKPSSSAGLRWRGGAAMEVTF